MVGYCPLIDGVEYNIHCSQTVAQAINTTMGQGDTIITLDLAIFVKAKQIQWRFANKFSDVVSWLGTFHIALNFLTVIGKKYVLKLRTWRSANSVRGVRDAPGTTSILMKGKSYNRGMQTHKLCLEAFFRLVRPEFVKWYAISSSCEQSRPISQEQLRAIISSGVAEVEKWGNIPKVHFPD